MNTDQPDSLHEYRWMFLIVISMGLLMIGIDNSILFTALPTIELALHTTEFEGLWVINAYPLILASLLLGTGTLGDKIGHRRMFEIGLVLFGAASLAAAFSWNPEVLILSRGLLGAGAATMMPATLALLRLTFRDVRERNTAIGIWGSVAALGAAAGPLVGGFFLEHFWWGSVFLLNVPIVLIALVGTWLIAPANHPDPTRHWDFASSWWAMWAMAGFVLIIKTATHPPIHWLLLVISAIVAVVASWLFAIRQRRLAQPVLSMDVFSNKVFNAGVVGAALAMFILSGNDLMTAQRFQLSAGFTPLEAGGLTALAAISAFPSSIFGGAYLDRIGFRPLISGGFIVMALGGALASVFVQTSLIGFGIGFIFLGIGAGLTMSVTSTAIIGSAPASRAGMASAVEEVAYEWGTLLSVAIMGSLFSLFYSLQVPQEIAGNFTTGLSHPTLVNAAKTAMDYSYQWILWIIIGIALLGAGITAVLLQGNPKETEFAHE